MPVFATLLGHGTKAFNWIVNKLSKNPKKAKLLMSLGLLTKKSDRDSIYNQTISDFEKLNKLSLIVEIFMETTIKNSFLDDYYGRTQNSIDTEITTIIKTNTKYEWFLSNNYNLKTEIEEFKNLFNKNVGNSRQPKEQEAFQLINQFKKQVSNDEKQTEILLSFKIDAKEKNYIKRTYVKFGEKAGGGFWLQNEVKYKETLIEIISAKDRLVILGNGGSGKTVDFINAVYTLKEDKNFVPVYLQLKFLLNSKIEEFLPSGWDRVFAKQLVIFLDGLDEVQSIYFNNTILSIVRFANNHPKIKIVISCRTTHYILPIGGYDGSISGFDVYEISDFDNSDIIFYVENAFQINGRKFLEDSFSNGYYDLVKKPFFLKELLEIYSNSASYPQNRVTVFNTILDRIFTDEQNHYKNTLEYSDVKNKILRLLREVALAMEIIGKNIITPKDLSVFLSEEDYKLLKYFPAFRQESNNDTAYWTFVHNNIQELLAAQLLVEQKFEKILPFISFEPDYKILNPSWANTLSFLFGILPKTSQLLSDLLAWIVKNEQYETLVQLEAEKIPVEVRKTIFENIYLKYTKNSLWINRSKYKYQDIARFGEMDSTINFILDEIEKADSIYSLSNSLNIFRYFSKYSMKQRIRAEKLLLGLLDTQTNSEIINVTIDALSETGLITEDKLDFVINKFSGSKSQYVRSAIYKAILITDRSDKYLQFLLDGYLMDANNIRSETYTLAGVSEVLNLCIKNAKSPESIKIIIEFIITNHEVKSSYYFKDIFPSIVRNGIEGFTEQKSLFDSFYFLITHLSNHFYRDGIDLCVNFFKVTNTTTQLLQKVINKDAIKKYKYTKIITKIEISDFAGVVVSKYLNGEITNEDVEFYYNILMYEKDELSAELFMKFIEENLQIVIKRPEKIDLQRIANDKIQREFDTIFSKSQFTNEINNIYSQFENDVVTEDELYVIRSQSSRFVDLDEIFSQPALNLLRSFSRNKQDVNKKEVLSFISDPARFEKYQISQIMIYLKNNQWLQCSTEQYKFISDWCFRTLQNFDFKTAIYQSFDNHISIKVEAQQLNYFRMRLLLNFPESILLDMLSFEYPDNTSMGIEFIVDQVGKEKVAPRVIDNLKNSKFIFSQALLNHVDFVLKNKISEGYSLIAKKILDTTVDIHTRISILRKFTKSLMNDSILKEILIKSTDIYLTEEIANEIMQLSPNDSFLNQFLCDYLKEELQPEYRIRIANLLLKMESLVGLKEIALQFKTVDSTNQDFLSTRFEPLSQFGNPEGLDLLFEMLYNCWNLKSTITSNQDLKYIESSIVGAIFKIGLSSDENFIIVKKKYLEFMHEYVSKYPELRFTTTIVENMEQQFMFNKAKSSTAKDALEKVKQLL